MPSFGKCFGGLDDEPRRVHRRPARRCVLGELRQLRCVVLDPAVEVDRRLSRRIPQRVDQLRHHTAQVADQRDVDGTVDADGHRILFDQNPFALGVVLRPVPGLAVVARFAELSAERDAQIGLHHRLDGRRRESVGEGAVLETLDERGATGGLDYRALHELGQLPDRCTGA